MWGLDRIQLQEREKKTGTRYYNLEIWVFVLDIAERVDEPCLLQGLVVPTKSLVDVECGLCISNRKTLSSIVVVGPGWSERHLRVECT
jgi:hypothetical protein